MSEGAPPEGEAAARAAEEVRLLRRRVLRIGAVVLFAGGAFFWLRGHAPRPVTLIVDLDSPREVREVDLIVRRQGTLLRRLDQRFPDGAPASLRVEVRAVPGPADVELVVVGAQGPARRTQGTVQLDEEVPAVFAAGR